MPLHRGPASKGELVGDDPVVGILAAGAAEDLQGLQQVAAGVVVVAVNGDVLGDPQRRVGLVGQPGTDVAYLDVAAARRHHLQAFLGNTREAAHFHDRVGTPASGQLAHATAAPSRL